MDLILFFIIAVITIILSIKLSHYADMLDKGTKAKGFFIGGVLLAGVTSLPELVTTLSSVSLNNPALAIGDIIGSIIYNFIIIVVLDLIFIRKRFMNKISDKYVIVHLILIYIFVILIAYFKGELIGGIYNIGLPTIIIIICYLIYLLLVSKTKLSTSKPKTSNNKPAIIIKFTLTSILMVIVSILLTINVNQISIIYSNFSASVIGAFLLGITTSLPEAVSTYVLIRMGSYNLGYSNIVGSNMVDFLIIALADFFVPSKIIYDFYDQDTLLLTYLGLAFCIILIYPIIRQRSNFKITYLIPSLVILLIYLMFWYYLLLGN